MAVVKVVFDTNVFSPGSFDLLEASPMLELRRRGSLVPIYGHVFLEETFRAYGLERMRSDLVTRWLPFIANTAPYVCNDFVSIFHEELVQGRGPYARLYLPMRDLERFRASISNIPLDGSWRPWHSSKKERDIENGKRLAQRALSKEIRAEVADWRKTFVGGRKRGHRGLATFLRSEVDAFGRDFICTTDWIAAHKPRAIAEMWARDKQRYPFFTTFCINMLYITHHAMTQHNAPIDINAQADLDLMTHLLHSDILVSNDSGFLRQAFDDLWRPRRKVLFTTEDFVDFIPMLLPKNRRRVI